jgi:beta-ureidopropionase / N-carbamoyl-L-amino-acid hydrolase
MDRRAFNRTLAGALAGAAAATARALPLDATGPLRGPAWLLDGTQPLRIDGSRLNGWLATLSGYGRNDLGGVTRPSYTEADLAARAWVRELMEAGGLDVSIDTAGNIVGRRDGSESELLPLSTGSHIDSVPEGGRYDGNVGALAAIEVATTLHQTGTRLRHPLEVLIFQNEENGKVGSKALAGADPATYLDFVTNSGLTVREGIERIGGNAARVRDAARAPGSLAAFVELHIEQGGALEAANIPIGVVEGIVGIRRWNVEVTGFANHAGTTPMDRRQDALLGAARLVEVVNRVVRSREGRQVGTVGTLRAEPGAANVIAGRAFLTIELRDLSMTTIDAVFAEIQASARTISSETDTQIAFDPVYRTEPAACDDAIRSVIGATAEELGLATMSLPSGAGHDAQEMALIGPMGMIFVPSRSGISHSAEEFTAPDDIERGANVLLHTLLRLDRTA